VKRKRGRDRGGDTEKGMNSEKKRDKVMLNMYIKMTSVRVNWGLYNIARTPPDHKVH